MTLSGKLLVALADYFEDHFEYFINAGNGAFPTIVRTDELRDFFIEYEYPKHVVTWGESIPKQPGQIKRAVLACQDYPSLIVRFAEDILARPVPAGRHVDGRARKKLLEALEMDGFRFEANKLLPTNEKAEELLVAARAIDRRAGQPPTVPCPDTLSPAVQSAQAKSATTLTDREAMERTVTLARQSVGEDPKKPKVAALVVTADGRFIGEAYRGELKSGEHAEYILLERKLKNEVLVGATVFTTLEPCTSRSPEKVPCADRLLERKVKRVVIGMVDPNPDIRGNGQRRLVEAGVHIVMYDLDLVNVLEELNREFTRQFKNPG